MFKFNTISAAVSGAVFSQQLFKTFPKAMQCLMLLLRFSYPVTVSTSAWTPPAIGTLLPAAMNGAIGQFSFAYGEQYQHSVYSQVSGAEMRSVQRFILGREVVNTLPTSSTAVGNYNWTFDLVVPFSVPGVNDGRRNLPGYSQMISSVLNITEGLAYSNTNGGTVARNQSAQATCDVDFIAIPGGDQWSPLLTYAKSTGTDLSTKLQDGILVGLWEQSAAFGATAIQFYQLTNNTGAPVDAPLTNQIPPYVGDDNFTYDWLVGGTTGASNVDDTVTVLWSPQQNFSLSQLPAGKPTITFPAMYVTQFNFRQLYFPVLGEAEAQEAAKLSANAADKNVLLYHDASNTKMSDQHARSAAAIVATADQPQYLLNPGVIAKPNSSVLPNMTVPTHVLNSIGGNLAAAGKTSAGTANAASASNLKNLAKLIPGLSPVAATSQSGAAAQTAIVSKLRTNGVSINA